jgi:hypothetical protein
VERIIAKIDNDFNPNNSDWIPRVGAWCIDAMAQLDILRTKRKKKKLIVIDRIAYSDCPLTNNNIKIYDNRGCKIEEAKDSNACNDCPSTGESASETSGTSIDITPSTINAIETGNKQAPDYVIANTVNDKYPFRYNVQHYTLGNNTKNYNYVIVNNDKIELNFDTDFIYIEYDYIETTCSERFGCELPVIPNNGLLIEAIAYYCMYKMLCRGYKHPVFNLQASQYGTNPYYMWTQLKDEAKRSILNNSIDDASKLFRSNLFIDTFDPRG